MMLRIGLTGGIASGKSTVSAYLASLGAPIVDADKISRDIMQGDVLSAVKEAFPDCFSDGMLDRRSLGRKVFSDDEARKRLEGITLPAIIREAALRLDMFEKAGAPAAIFDAPTLFESGAVSLVDTVWVVKGGDGRLDRIMKRDGLTACEAAQRMRAQMPEEEKLALADEIIDNSGDLQTALDKARSLWLAANGGFDAGNQKNKKTLH